MSKENEIEEVPQFDFRLIDNELDEIKTYLRILAQPLLEKHLSIIFKNHKQMRAYELSDGIRGSREIGDLIGKNFSTITLWWKNWEKKGIAEKTGKQGQYRKKYSLIDLITINNNKKWVFLTAEEELIK